MTPEALPKTYLLWQSHYPNVISRAQVQNYRYFVSGLCIILEYFYMWQLIMFNGIQESSQKQNCAINIEWPLERAPWQQNACWQICSQNSRMSESQLCVIAILHYVFNWIWLILKYQQYQPSNIEKETSGGAYGLWWNQRSKSFTILYLYFCISRSSAIPLITPLQGLFPL